MEAIINSGEAEVVAIADPMREMALQAARIAPHADLVPSLFELLDAGLDGIAIATPTASHADQCMAAIDKGLSVFCQEPLGRSAAETQAIIGAARGANCLMLADSSYRYPEGMRFIRGLIQGGELGSIYSVDLVFHTAHGPDKPWYYDPAQSGGGCVMDLGSHLIDLALWTLDFPQVTNVTSRLFTGGLLLGPQPKSAEDYAVAQLDLEGGVVVRLTCSWKLDIGQDALIEASFYGTKGGAIIRNANGSFADFTAERISGIERETLSAPPDEWGGRAAVEWARRLGQGERYDPQIEHVASVAATIDAIYGR